MKRVHIVGAPRSGTTLMLELMRTGFGFRQVLRTETPFPELPSAMMGAETVLSKKPGDHAWLEHVLPVDGNAWFIALLRDPRDMVVSRHGGAPDRYWANLRQWHRAHDRLRAWRDHSQLRIVGYERLVAQPDAVQDELAEWLTFLPRRQRFSEFHRFSRPTRESRLAMHRVRPIDDASVGRWRQHLPRLAGQLAQHGPISKVLIELGYEEDDAWLEALDGVEPDLTPSRWPEFRDSKPQNQDALRSYYRACGADLENSP
ncbi:MAG: sulfotransferase [Pseudomonadota bacterium]